jgi:hypothetical protein
MELMLWQAQSWSSSRDKSTPGIRAPRIRRVHYFEPAMEPRQPAALVAFLLSAAPFRV